LPAGHLDEIVASVESWLMRRALLRLSTKGYAPRPASALGAGGRASRQVLASGAPGSSATLRSRHGLSRIG
jgi:hypothetical protein